MRNGELLFSSDFWSSELSSGVQTRPCASLHHHCPVTPPLRHGFSHPVIDAIDRGFLCLSPTCNSSRMNGIEVNRNSAGSSEEVTSHGRFQSFHHHALVILMSRMTG